MKDCRFHVLARLEVAFPCCWTKVQYQSFLSFSNVVAVSGTPRAAGRWRVAWWLLSNLKAQAQ
jgi:hypothetical protein